MSPVTQPTVLDLQGYQIRHIGPKALLWPDTIGSQFTVLARTDLIARPLPQSNLPYTNDFVSGTWTNRVNDAGDAKFIWPNKEASDGPPWRFRFDPTGKLQWLEVYINGWLEGVYCVTKVIPDRNQVEVDCYDGFQMCKSAYVRDWTVVQAPRDVIERGTQLWMPLVADNFPLGLTTVAAHLVTTPYATWHYDTTFPYIAPTPGPNGGLLTQTVSAGAACDLYTNLTTLPAPTGVYSAQASFVTSVANASVQLSMEEYTPATGIGVFLYLSVGGATAGSTTVTALFEWADGVNVYDINATIPLSTTYSLNIESDGDTNFGFINGQLIGYFRRNAGTAAQLAITVIASGTGTGSASIPIALLTQIQLDVLQSFLQRGTDKGEYVLPGGQSTYPVGGLHARYYNDIDLQSDAGRLQKILTPPRSQAYAGSGGSEYANQQDAQISAQQNPLPGAVTSNWSCRWFGSVYLKLSGGNYTFSVQMPAVNSAVRVWVGKTKLGDQVTGLDQWAYSAVGGLYTGTVTAASLSGTDSVGNVVARDGWYPIKVEYSVDATAGTAPVLKFTPPVTYTDPGGTALTGSASVTIPATSLSTLGCIDNRYQGTSHFDLVQKTCQAVGYQFSVHPQQLESGLFPGVLAPRLDEGQNVDVILEPDDSPRREGIINYSSSVDGTDQASSVQGNGAGFQNGTTGQLQANVYDPFTLSQSLFDMQAWQDNADASFGPLLAALLNSQLANRLTPWQIVSGDPIARERQVFTWPLPGALSQMRWRPGDGVMIRARDINVNDTVPRQLLLVTRNIMPNGLTSTQVGFAGRPKSSVYANRQVLAASLRPQRNYQKSLVSLNGTYVATTVAAGSGNASVPSYLALAVADQVIRSRLRVTLVSGTTPSYGVGYYNGSTWVDVTALLGGPWSKTPLNLDVSAYTASGTDRFVWEIINKSANAITAIEFQVFVDVLR